MSTYLTKIRTKFETADSCKKRKTIAVWIRAAVQILFFIWFPSLFTAAFAGVRYIAVQIGHTEPFALTPFVRTLCGLCLFTILFGRFFCGFACAFGSFGDALHAACRTICKKCKKKPLQLPEKLCRIVPVIKYIVLGMILVLCFTGQETQLQGSSPWEVFSLLRMGNVSLHGKTVGLILLILLVAGMCIKERFFCLFFCPMGAVFSLLPVLPFFPCTETGHPVCVAAAAVPETARLPWNCRRMECP